MSSAVQRELSRFFSRIKGGEYSIHSVTKGALTQARAKLKPEAFLELNKEVVRHFYEGAPYHVWKNHRVLAADGSCVMLPSHDSIREVFGEHGVGPKADIKRSMATISKVYDVLNLVTLDAAIDRFDRSEETLLAQHLEAVTFLPGDILLLDRGYPSIALMYQLQQRSIHFCIRMQTSWWKEVRLFLEEKIESKEVTFRLPSKDRNLLEKWPNGNGEVRCRLVAIKLGNGDIEVLCTSLLDEDVYRIADLKELYHQRWNIEEAYKLLKNRAELEVFSGKTAIAIQQDFYAKIFMLSACAAMSHPIEQQLREESNRPQKRKINRTNALGFLKDAWISIWLRKKTTKVLAELDRFLLKTTEMIREGRSNPRKHHRKRIPPANHRRL